MPRRLGAEFQRRRGAVAWPVFARDVAVARVDVADAKVLVERAGAAAVRAN